VIDILVKTTITVVFWAALFSTNCVTYFVHFTTKAIQPNPEKKVLCKTSSYNFYISLKLPCEMNMADERSFALGTKAGNCRTWPIKDADKQEGGAASFETKVMVKLKKSVLTLETGSQREQILSVHVTFWAKRTSCPPLSAALITMLVFRMKTWLHVWYYFYSSINKTWTELIFTIFIIWYNSSVVKCDWLISVPPEVCVIVLNVHNLKSIFWKPICG